MALLGHRGERDAYEIYTGRDIQKLQIWHESVCDIIAVLESNVEVLSSMATFYRNLQAKKDFPLANLCGDDIDDFVEELDLITSGFKMQISRGKSLRQRTMERSELVRLPRKTTSLPPWRLIVPCLQVKQHLANQASDRLERLNRNMEKEAIVVRIITIVTLIYLPATFSSVCHDYKAMSRSPFCTTDL